MSKIFSFILFISVLALITSSCGGNDKQQSQDAQIENPYQSYIDWVDENVKSLNSDQKSRRKEMLDDLKNNPIYKELILNGVISVEYLDVLSAISQGVSRITADQYSFEEEPFATIIKGSNGEIKKEFIIKVVALGMEENGGIPLEILKVFDKYQQKYRFYGEKGSIVSDGTSTIEIPVDFDITGFLAVVCPKNEAVLDAVFESRSRGYSTWTSIEDSKYSYLSSLRSFMDYLGQFYTSSQYYLKPDKEVTANQLYTIYENNEIKGDNNFKGKMIVVTGKISDFGIDLLDMPFISLEIGDFKAVTCYFTIDKSNMIGELSKGDQISILGTCHGNTLGNIVIDDCIIWE